MAAPFPPDWLTLTDEEIRDWILATAESESGFRRSASVGPITGLWETVALAFQRGWDVGVRPIAGNIDPEIATGFYLRVLGIVAGVRLRDPRAAQGYATVTSTTGGRIRAGAILEAGDQRFAVDTSTRLPAGAATAVAITAEVAGAAGNVASGTEVTIASPDPADVVARLDAQWLTIYGHDGDDLSSDAGVERFRRRVVLGFEIRGEAEIHARYRLAAFGVDGVSSVSVGRTPRGYGSADVAVLFDGLLPTEAQLAIVRAAIDEAALGGRDVRAVEPRIVSVAVRATITGTATVNDVEDAIAAWFRANVGIGDGVTEAALHAGATAGVAGITSINYSSPAADLPARPGIWYQPAITVTTA